MKPGNDVKKSSEGFLSIMDDQTFFTTILINIALSCVGFYVTLKLIPGLSHMFVRSNLFGVDMSKVSKAKMCVYGLLSLCTSRKTLRFVIYFIFA